jgi:hypothetical protein
MVKKFDVGQIVKVLPEEKIRKTLDSQNMLDGCLFMTQMWQYCGQAFKVKIFVKNIYFEKMLTPQVPIYILQNFKNLQDLRCEGKVPFVEEQCGRSCNLVWHQQWLEEANLPEIAN